MVTVFGLRTLLIDLLVCQLALVAHKAAHDAREEVGAARVTGVARGVLGSALVKALLFAVVTGLVSVAGSCRKSRRRVLACLTISFGRNYLVNLLLSS